MRAVLLLFLILLVKPLLAQIPGFQGKRFSVEGSLMFNTALSNPNENFNKGIVAFNKRVQAGGEYILGRSICIGGSVGFMNSGLSYRHSYYYPNNGYYSSAFATEKYSMSCVMGGAYFKFFKFRRKGSIAPYGSYAKLGIIITDIKSNFVDSDNNAGIIPRLSDQTKVVLLNYGFGRQFIIKGKFIARAGADFGINLGLLSRASNLSNASKKRIDSAMMFNLEAGVGVLIF